MANGIADSVKEAVSSTLKETGFDPGEDPRDGVKEETSVAEVTSKEEEVSETVEDKEDTSREVEDKEEVRAEKKELIVEKEEEDFRPTAEELEAINQSPELKKVYRSMVKGFTEKTGHLATKRKEAERAMLAIKALQENPQQTIRALASAAGMKIVEDAPISTDNLTEKSVVERLQEKLEAKIGKEGAEVLAPVLLEAIGVVNEEKLAPIQAAIKKQEESEQLRNLRANISDFGSKIVEDGGEWNQEIETEIAKLVGKILPGEGMTLPGYLEVLHNNVLVARDRRGVKEREVTRLHKAIKGKEPVRPARPISPATPSIKPGMDVREATAMAVAAARQEVAGR